MLRRAVVPPLAAMLVAAGCTGEPAGGTEPRVGGPFGARPAIVFPRGEPAAGLRVAERPAGTGARLKAGDVAIVQYTAHEWDGGRNRLIDSSFNRGVPAALPVGRLAPGLDRALQGRAVGSRVIAAIPYADGPGAHAPTGPGTRTAADGARPSGGARPPDGARPSDGARSPDDARPPDGGESFYVVDILGAHSAGAFLDGPGGSLAGVRVTGGPRPRLTVPRTAPPDRFAATVLHRGAGRPVRAGGLVVVQYAGAIWDTGRVFDTTWTTGRPRAFRIGDGTVIKAWDAALAGVPAGSRVLMIVPPSHGYGAPGDPAYGIGGSDTLVFAVDVLAAY